MKYVFIVMIAFMSGCASVPSEYNQGCRDGISNIVEFNSEYKANGKEVNKFCDNLDRAHQSKKRMEKEMGR